MKTRLIEIIKVLKEVIKETNLNITDNTLLEQASTYHRGELAQESRANYQNDKKVSYNQDMKGIDRETKSNSVKATDKQKLLMTKLKIPYTNNTTINEAKELIEIKLGKNKEY